MWSCPNALKAPLLRLWERGELLRDAVTGHSRFPLRLSFKGPTSSDLTERFEAVRAWASTLASTPALRLEWQTVHHRVQGTQNVPSRIWIDSMEIAVRWLSKHAQWERFCAMVAMTKTQCPAVLPWLEKRPLLALEHHDDWPSLLAVIHWVACHPRPGIYLREVDLPCIHSKFIEAHRGVLAECLDLVLPPTQIDTSKTGVAQFAARYGFREKPLRVRFRILDPAISLMANTVCPDITLDADNFSRLTAKAWGVQQVLITENETNFLSLPSLPFTLALFGAGYGWQALAQATWLNACDLHYWGDIDTHGFAILDRLREYCPHVRSFLMDETTLHAHVSFWGREDTPHRGELHRLTPEENTLYTALRNNHLRENLRLEQEHLGFSWVACALGRIHPKAREALPSRTGR
jgi:hypothetical protein